MPTAIHPLPEVDPLTIKTPYIKPDFHELVREALAFHGEVRFEHLLGCLRLWRPPSWFPKRWPERVRRVLRCDPKIEEVSPGLFRLRAEKSREPFTM